MAPPAPVRAGLAWLRNADPVLARVIDEHPAFDPNAFMQRLPKLDLFGALPDLVRTDDIALRRAIRLHYGLDRLPDPDEVAALARRWSPYGSLASSLLLAAARSK